MVRELPRHRPGESKALLNCVSCHNLDRIVRSQYDAEQFVDIFNRMVGYYPGSTPEHPQRLVGSAQRSLGQGPGMRATAEYLVVDQPKPARPGPIRSRRCRA